MLIAGLTSYRVKLIDGAEKKIYLPLKPFVFFKVSFEWNTNQFLYDNELFQDRPSKSSQEPRLFVHKHSGSGYGHGRGVADRLVDLG
jgi:hypothetical protein